MIAGFYEQFIAGATDQGLAEKEAKDFWELIIQFAGYGFNKSHSTAYALIAYMTAYLKAHYPVEFMAALLSGDIPGRNFKRKDSLVEHLEDCQRMDIEVVPPNVNTSCVDFTVEGKKIFFGLSAIKGCGGGAAEAIEQNRAQHGPFKDLFDFCERVDPSACNRAAIETLIKAGAFDGLGGNRAQWMSILERALQAGASALADKKSGQKSLFGDDDDGEPEEVPVDLPDMPDWDERESLLFEKEVLGFYLSSHPLKQHEDALLPHVTHGSDQLGGLKDRAEVTMGGMVSSIKLAHTRNPKPGKPSKYANFDLEDMAGNVRCIMWPEQFAQYGETLQGDAIVVARGAIDRRGGGDEANLIINELLPLDQLDSHFSGTVMINVSETHHGEHSLEKLKEILRGYPGNCDLNLCLSLSDGARVSVKPADIRVEVNSELKARLRDLLGETAVQLRPKGRVATKKSNGARRAAS